MMRRITIFFDGFIFRHFFIALCAASMVFATFILNDLHSFWSPFTIFLTISTFLLYNFHAHSFSLNYKSIGNFVDSFKALKIGSFYSTLYGIALILAFYEALQFSFHVLLYTLPLIILTLLYSIPLWGLKNKIRIRELIFVKIPLISIVWSLTTVIIPLVEQNIDLDSSFVFKQIICRFLFVFALCVPFEIRDLEIDRSQNVKTLATVFGVKAIRNLGILFLLLEIMIHHSMRIPLKSIVALDLSSVIALFWILIQKKQMGIYFYKLFVDGTMVLRFVFIYLASILL